MYLMNKTFTFFYIFSRSLLYSPMAENINIPTKYYCNKNTVTLVNILL